MGYFDDLGGDLNSAWDWIKGRVAQSGAAPLMSPTQALGLDWSGSDDQYGSVLPFRKTDQGTNWAPGYMLRAPMQFMDRMGSQALGREAYDPAETGRDLVTAGVGMALGGRGDPNLLGTTLWGDPEWKMPFNQSLKPRLAAQNYQSSSYGTNEKLFRGLSPGPTTQGLDTAFDTVPQLQGGSALTHRLTDPVASGGLVDNDGNFMKGPGDTVNFPTFLSTSNKLFNDYGQPNKGEPNHVGLHFYQSPGSPGLDVNSFLGDDSAHIGEHEVILPRNTSWNVLSTGKYGDQPHALLGPEGYNYAPAELTTLKQQFNTMLQDPKGFDNEHYAMNVPFPPTTRSPAESAALLERAKVMATADQNPLIPENMLWDNLMRPRQDLAAPVTGTIPKQGIHADYGLGAADDQSWDPAFKAPDSTGVPMGMSDFTKIGEKPGGSVPGALYQHNGTGDHWIIKDTGDDQARNEVLAGKLYEAMGVKVPQLSLIKGGDGNYRVGSKFMPDFETDPAAVKAGSIPGIHDNFVPDAFMGNWDVAGLDHDNIGRDAAGNAVRIDLGGSLQYRAQGGKKTPAQFGPQVSELDSLRDPNMNPQAAQTFAGVQPQHLVNGALKVAGLTNQKLSELVGKYGPASPQDRLDLLDTLQARRQDITDNLLNNGAPPSKPAAAPPSEAASPSQDAVENAYQAWEKTKSNVKNLYSNDPNGPLGTLMVHLAQEHPDLLPSQLASAVGHAHEIFANQPSNAVGKAVVTANTYMFNNPEFHQIPGTPQYNVVKEENIIKNAHPDTEHLWDHLTPLIKKYPTIPVMDFNHAMELSAGIPHVGGTPPSMAAKSLSAKIDAMP